MLQLRFVTLTIAASALATVTTGCKTGDAAATVKSSDAAAPSQVTLSAAANPVVLDGELGEQAWPHESDVTNDIADLIKTSIEQRYPPGDRPARRDAHPKAHGCVRAAFHVNDDLPPALAQGAFVAGKTYKTWIRFSNGDADPTRADIKGDARGMAIKIIGVPGENLLPAESNATTQDFILINHPVFFVDNPETYLSLIKKVNSSNPLVNLAAPVALGLKGALIAAKITGKTIANPLETRFWSMVPYRLGDDQHKQAVKFSARPCTLGTTKIPTAPAEDYLRTAMRATLAAKDACFEFLVQPRTTPSMSVENSMTEWQEAEAPFIKVATITIPKQFFDAPAQREFCENLSFTPWHSLPEHRPLGGINRVRRVVYEEVSKFRHGLNGAPRQEPTGDETF